ncbi:aldehyde dehydrogenase [Arhodomonas sp. AD133]|uniref:aldehyde dehydrogenase n=1 Tax=Arhodomonas sp. AD133 TaxID=3415009 RepID=UPI003EBE8419
MDQPAHDYWRAKAAELTAPTDTYIDGEFTPAASGARFRTHNPATGELIAEVAACDASDVDRAVAVARRVHGSGAWWNQDPAARKTVMLAIAESVRANAEELAVLDAVDGGKCIDEALDDVEETAKLFQWFGEAIDKVHEEVAPAPPGTLATVTYEPAGVVGAVVPWNFPLHNAAVKVAPALAAGNTVVLKPAEDTPLSALRLAELATAAGLPAGALNVVPGFGADAGEPLGRHPDVDVLGFTGSTGIGKRFLAYSAESNMKPVWLECGGKSPNVVFDDCHDIDAAVENTIAGIFTHAGQVCSAHSRLLVQRGIAETFIERLLERVRSLRPGDPLDPASDFGAMINARQHQKVLDYIAMGREEATLRCGGDAVSVHPGGHFIAPTVFTDVPADARIAREEIFGPVLAVTTFDTEAEAVALANASIYGLAASVWTASLARAHRMTRAVAAGTVSVNTVDAVSLQTPFGGMKQSGIGRDYAITGMHKYMAQKTSWIQYADEEAFEQ